MLTSPEEGVLRRLKVHLQPVFSPQQLEHYQNPNQKEEGLISSILADTQRGLEGKPLEEKREDWYQDLVYYITQFTLFQREKQRQEGKMEDFFLHKEQVLALIRAIDYYQKGKGAIFQMKTGEGKSQVVIPIFLAWLEKRETNIHIHQVNPYLLEEAYNQFLNFADYLGIRDQIGKLSLNRLEEIGGKKIIFGHWHDFIHWYQLSFLKQAPSFPGNPLLVLDEIDQLLMDEAITPEIISEEIKTAKFLEDFLEHLKNDLNLLKRPVFKFDYQGGQITIDPKEYDEALNDERKFIDDLQVLISLGSSKLFDKYIQRLKEKHLSEKEIRESLLGEFDYLFLQSFIIGRLRKTEPNFQPSLKFLEELKKTYDENPPYFWFADPELNESLISVLLMVEGEDYVIKEGKIIPLAPTTGYQEREKKFSPLVEIFLHIKHNLSLPETVTIEKDRLSTFEFYQKFNRIYGFTGTASTVARRLYEGYGLETRLIPSHYPDNRISSFLFFPNKEDKSKAIAEAVFTCYQKNILVVVSDPKEARQLQEKLIGEGSLEINILSAQNQEEDWQLYQWISSASDSEKKRVLITVKMIGRGVDLRPDEEVKKQGFLLLAASPFEYQRSYLQLVGRVGRRGERGEVRTFVSPDDPIFGILSGDKRKRLNDFFQRLNENQKEIVRMIEAAWGIKEDEVTESFA
ncbi:MAG: hypothetical protein ACK4FL_03505, partial [Microgenomates group bacterium]